MTATSLNALRNEPASLSGADDRMDQVRELLVGDRFRTTEARLNALEARARDMETELSRQIDALSVRLEALAGEVDSDRRSAFDELATDIGDLSERIRKISKP